ncbi:hypothetical protein NIES2109_60050 (plasmid) [Nostoc sp. HK-01]|nr:hypothetical protein NIES2109_03070 [Nostoc sp. HK-01]BBD58752.1 hypothetical protein NIES2109_15300 [Nostoc sp. HK-01]BBD59311.1 hypothetical protein NIES2109_20940 [Nostoc sp. HK-01]BBD59916.1 hypothetical protein NIES2109_27070 [Nostoc sp. HK-01]BBD60253.1 hypothetical protein NIES2109_30500 [Nostoc sp. HK-01]
MQQVIECGNSYRGVEKTFDLYKELFTQETPSFSSIRKWLGRIGFFELTRKKEIRDDWIFIVDLTVELGTEKGLVILGVSQQKLEEEILPLRRGLQHQDVQILALEIMHSTRGELIQEKLTEVSLKCGCPRQIIADHGSDIQKGIKLYQQNHPDVIYTYDVTHAMALLLKHELHRSDKYQSFIQQCSQCRKQLQQTELSFLSPPSQRSQCRYFNLEKLVNWALYLLNSPLDILRDLVPNTEPDILYSKLKEKFTWLAAYQDSLINWKQMVQITRFVETQIKLCGLNQETFSIIQQHLTTLVNYSEEFAQKILSYLTQELSFIQPGQTLLATTDVLESLFGKYKQFSSRSPFKQIGQMFLSICLSTMNLTTTLVKEALETVRFLDVEDWAAQVFGQSMLSKRRILFSVSTGDTEIA